MSNKAIRKNAKNEMEKFIAHIENETGVAMIGDWVDLDLAYKYDWKKCDEYTISKIVEAWKINILYSKPYINNRLRNYTLSEMRRGNL